MRTRMKSSAASVSRAKKDRLIKLLVGQWASSQSGEAAVRTSEPLLCLQ